MIPARSAPDLQCITAGYSTRLKRSMAPSTCSRVGASREETAKFSSFRPSRAQASFSSR